MPAAIGYRTMVVKQKLPKRNTGSSESKAPTIDVKEARKADAMALAELIYDVFVEEKSSGKLLLGHNNANRTSN